LCESLRASARGRVLQALPVIVFLIFRLRRLGDRRGLFTRCPDFNPTVITLRGRTLSLCWPHLSHFVTSYGSGASYSDGSTMCITLRSPLGVNTTSEILSFRVLPETNWPRVSETVVKN
jgi:hypothetical protein